VHAVEGAVDVGGHYFFVVGNGKDGNLASGNVHSGGIHEDVHGGVGWSDGGWG